MVSLLLAYLTIGSRRVASTTRIAFKCRRMQDVSRYEKVMRLDVLTSMKRPGPWSIRFFMGANRYLLSKLSM